VVFLAAGFFAAAFGAFVFVDVLAMVDLSLPLGSNQTSNKKSMRKNEKLVDI